jgi:DNA-binding transcriptional MocR family regulator
VLFSIKEVVFRELGPPRYEQLSDAIERAVRDGRLRSGDRLPPVRQLAKELAISVTTVTAAFNRLSERKIIRAEAGRGTFVATASATRIEERAMHAHPTPLPGRAPWRRRALMTLGARLRARYPAALDCSTGRPDVTLLPWVILQRAWRRAFEGASAADLQYAGPEAVEALGTPLVRLLDATGIPSRTDHLLVGSSAQQWMMLSLKLAASLAGSDGVTVAVEEPGYPTILDAYERAGARLLGVAVDEHGAVPASLDAAFRAGAAMSLLTPSAHNPTGASWSPERRVALAAVLAEHPTAIVVEDDQFADAATTRPGSLLSDARVEHQVIYIRSFSKLIAPDLRVAVAAARPRLRTLLADAKSFSDGWTSRLLQRTLAHVLEDTDLPDVLAHARETYRWRRSAAAAAANALLTPNGGGTWCGPDGLNLWVQLPQGVDAADVIERAAAAGVRIAPGEPFFIRPGHHDVVRLNAGSAPGQTAADAGRLVAEAALTSRSHGHSLIHV